VNGPGDRPGNSKEILMKAGTLLATIVALSVCHGAPAIAQMTRDGHGMAAQEKKVMVQNPWARASVGRNGAAFMTVANTGTSDDRLVAAKGNVARRVELHTHLMEGNVMKMRQVDAIPVPAGRSVTLKPGGLHVMMIGLEKKLVEGESFPLTLVFEKAGEITVTVPIGKIGAMGPDSGASMGHGGMGHSGMKH
jgi:copper(I)-binding protein